jgi:hypothetical protein
MVGSSARTILTCWSQLAVQNVSFWRLFHSTDMISAECSCQILTGSRCSVRGQLERRHSQLKEKLATRLEGDVEQPQTAITAPS